MKQQLSILKRDIKDQFLNVRSVFSNPGEGGVSNLYMATVQKTGSQWFKSVLSDPRIVKYTHLKEYPQRRYEYTEFVRKFPRNTFVPGLYISYDLYEEIVKPENYRTFYVVRDPRDIIVSWYWSMKGTHGLFGKVAKYRSAINSLSFDEGIHYCIDAYHMKLASMRSWMLNKDDNNVMVVYFEDIKSKPDEVISSLLDFSGFSVPVEVVKSVTNDKSKEKMRAKDMLKRIEGEESHFRKESSNHKNVFKREHFSHFYSSTGDLIDLLGYER